MREQLHLAVGVHAREVIPQRALGLRQFSLPLGLTGLEIQHGGAFLEAGGLAGHAGDGRADLHAVVGAGVIEHAQAHAMQDGAEGDVGASGDGVPQRDGAMGGKLGQEPFRQGLDRIAVVIVLGGAGLRPLSRTIAVTPEARGMADWPAVDGVSSS